MKNKFKYLIVFFFIGALSFNFSSCRSEKKSFRLPLVKPQKVGMSEAGLNRSRALIQEAISEKQFPGAVLLVARKGKVVLREAFGASQLVPEQKKMEVDSIFDLASLTKPIATATAAMILIEEGKLRLNDKIKDFVPEFKTYVDEHGKNSEDALIWHLLTHTSGLQSYTDAAAAAAQLGNPCSREALVKYIAQLPKNGPPGSKYEYSCLGFITLAYILEKVSGQAFNEFVTERIFKPLRMEHTFFKPGGNDLPKCVATEVIDAKPLIGIVHDPLARLQGGVSGNAGLFSTADDLAIFSQMLLQQGEFRGVRILSPLSVKRMTTIFEKAAFSGRGLGWDLASPSSSIGGDLFPAGSFGHTGYTGTSIWIDPATRTFVIFLTNRVHPDDKGDVGRMRSLVANAVASSILDDIKD
jgi:CubicO group peptidase (beta-lactamase class C family)